MILLPHLIFCVAKEERVPIEWTCVCEQSKSVLVRCVDRGSVHPFPARQACFLLISVPGYWFVLFP